MIKVKFVFENDSTEYILPLKKTEDSALQEQIVDYLKKLNIDIIDTKDEEKIKTYVSIIIRY